MTDITGGTCQQQPGQSSTPVNIWDSYRHGEPHEEADKRHSIARIVCNSCPILEECEDRLSRMEIDNEPVDGVTAGRFCDIRAHGSTSPIQSKCRGCRRPMRPQRNRDDQLREGDRQHMGEGLCHVCHPKMARMKNPKSWAA